MEFSNWLMFLLVALLTAFSPGPGILLAISNASSIGLKRAVVSSTGNLLGVFLVSGAAMLGLGALLNTSANAFFVVKVIGAGYLIYLGVRQWTSRTNVFLGVEQSMTAAGGINEVNGTGPSTNTLFTQGLAVAVTNPKSILFFTALFPQFIAQHDPVAMQFLVLTLTMGACVVLAHFTYVMLTNALKGWFATEQRARLFNRVSGGAFVALGLSLLHLKSKAA